MAQKILLPMDGSELAENAIPYVRELAAQLKAEVYLLHVCPAEHRDYNHMHLIYLNKLADNLRGWIKESSKSGQDPIIQVEVIPGEPLKVIIDYVKQKSIDIVALTSHGTSGFRAWAIGNTADQVVRRVGIPTLLIRVKEGSNIQSQVGPIKKILLPLDTSDASQIAVPYAVQLAKTLNASITLFSMTKTIYAQHFDGAGAGFGVNWDSIDASTEKYVEGYLKEIEDKIKKAGIEVNHTSYVSIDAAFEILEIEKKIQPDLIVMATRGRSQIARWALGSVAEKVLVAGNSPILMVKEPEGQINPVEGQKLL